jgi:hypothetical protein
MHDAGLAIVGQQLGCCFSRRGIDEDGQKHVTI